jgi:hypothetical protein
MNSPSAFASLKTAFFGDRAGKPSGTLEDRVSEGIADASIEPIYWDARD